MTELKARRMMIEEGVSRPIVEAAMTGSRAVIVEVTAVSAMVVVARRRGVVARATRLAGEATEGAAAVSPSKAS